MMFELPIIKTNTGVSHKIGLGNINSKTRKQVNELNIKL